MAGTQYKMSKELAKVSKDFGYMAGKYLRIRPKEPVPGKATVPFVFNVAQQIILDEVFSQLQSRGYVRIIVLKSRQQGVSTLIEALLYWLSSTQKGCKSKVVAHKGDSTANLFAMTRRYHENMPDALKPRTRYSSKTELVFSTLDSSMTVATAGGSGLGRSDTIQALHISELGWWPPGSASDNWSSLTDVLPPTPGTVAVVESTANGTSGVFYQQWQAAVSGTSDYVAVFTTWPQQPEYTADPPDGFVRSADEAKYAELFDSLYSHEPWYSPLTDGQVYWMRLKVAEKGILQFRQEYPLYPEEAFLSTGMSAFPGEHVGYLRDHAKPAIAVKGWVGDHWENISSGPLHIFKEITPTGIYVIGADTGAGISTSRADADYSAACVLDENGEQVATLRLRAIPGDFARMLYQLGILFNEALLCVENANHGYHVCQRLARDYHYPNLYMEDVLDKITEQYTERLGFTTSSRTKPMIINKLRDSVANTALGKADGVKVNDLTTLDEMRTYVLDEAGRFGADVGYHDDTVMALALARHVWSGPMNLLDGFEALIDPEGQGDFHQRPIFSDSDIPALYNESSEVFW